MALGGGKFASMDKSLPGAYINTISAPKDISIVGDNGIVAIAIEHDYGNNGEIIAIKPEDFREDSLMLFGYSLFDEKLKGLRELFENAKLVYVYILNKTTKATNTYATAKMGGARGNDITIKVQPNIEDPSKKDVITMMDYVVVDTQTVTRREELVDNAFVTFTKSGTLNDTAGDKLKSGANGTVTNAEHADFLKKLETLSFNAIACMSTTKTLQQIYISYTKRMRDEIGLKFAIVLCEASDLSGDKTLYDYEGVVVVKNKVKGTSVKGNELVPFTSAIYANAPIGKSNLNKKYTGEYEVITDFTQNQLKALVKEGMFVYHQVGDSVRVLEDVNGLITYSDTKGMEFRDNQVVRVTDALAQADARAFNSSYLGVVNIDKAGIESFENKVIEIRDYFMNKGALVGYDRETVKVEKVEGQRGAIKVTSSVIPAECFRQLYLTSYVR